MSSNKRLGAVSAQNQEDPFIGRQVGRYSLQKKIGAGGSGTVYQATHVDLGKRFAVKVLLASLVTDEETKARFQREMRVLAGIAHENVVSVTDAGYEKGIGPYMVMEWLDGDTLFEERKRRKYLEFDEILVLFEQFTDALGFMHQRNIIHRDLKPENMMLVARAKQHQHSSDSLAERVLKIFDFGIALLAEDDQRKLTAAGMVVGTPHYMSPEQIIIDAPVDHRADLYACGAILFELLTGQPPFWGVTRPIEVMERHLRHNPPELSQIAPHRNFPHGLQDVIYKSLAKSPDDRYQDAREMFMALQQILQPVAGNSSQGVHHTEEKTIVGTPNPSAFSMMNSQQQNQQANYDMGMGDDPSLWEKTEMVSNPMQALGGDPSGMNIVSSSSPSPLPSSLSTIEGESQGNNQYYGNQNNFGGGWTDTVHNNNGGNGGYHQAAQQARAAVDADQTAFTPAPTPTPPPPSQQRSPAAPKAPTSAGTRPAPKNVQATKGKSKSQGSNYMVLGIISFVLVVIAIVLIVLIFQQT